MRARVRILAMVIILATVATAKDKRPASDYSEGTVQSFRMVDDGMTCKAANVLNCSSTGSAEYAVKVGDQLYKLSPDTRGFHHSVLYLQPAGAKVLIRIDTNKGRAYVRVGERESKYFVVGIGQ